MAKKPALADRRRETTITPRMDLLKDHALFDALIPHVKLEIEERVPGAEELQEGHDRLFKVLQGARLPGIESEKESISVDGPSNEEALAELMLQKARVKEAVDVLWEYEDKLYARREPADVDIVATGHYRCDMAAYGVVYENANLDRDYFLYLYDDRIAPDGWYFYAVPWGEDKVELVNCVSKPYVPLVRKLYYRAVRDRKVLRDIVKGAKPVKEFGGHGGVDFPRSAVRGGTMYVGEAAGFGGIIAHGLLIMGFVGQAITQWIPLRRLKVFKVRFTGVTRPKDVITVTGKVSNKLEETRRIICAVEAKDQRGEIKIKGSFEAQLPARH